MRSEDIPVLTTGRTILRAPIASDFDDCTALWGDETVTRFIAKRPFTRDECWARLLRKIGHWQVMGFGFWVVRDKASDEFLGIAGFAEHRRAVIPSFEGLPEAGWVFAPSAHGRGLATEVMMRIVTWADENIESDTTVCMFDPEHHASRRVAEKVGFTVRGDATFHDETVLVMERARKAR
ncbi:GNAT family N-acetyltransferase [Ahrensia sp. R2A130]|uniref:GNAT family N-acetyltransferase n=1 Tax=Ahrensia sp. R2A130 TaxID=744979 RepID=UPI0001E0B4A8|nr:GNAT family N-acetyltransferase [Ahrensia sp. R2A130]EFL89733.1 acetyltransferase, gnat family [Ahrensia sp. R2A130]